MYYPDFREFGSVPDVHGVFFESISERDFSITVKATGNDSAITEDVQSLPETRAWMSGKERIILSHLGFSSIEGFVLN